MIESIFWILGSLIILYVAIKYLPAWDNYWIQKTLKSKQDTDLLIKYEMQKLDEKYK